MITTDRAVFVKDFERSDGYIIRYVTEVDLMTLVIKADKTGHSSYYELFKEWKEKGRTLNQRLFASYKLEKVIDFVNQYLTK